MKKYIKPIPLFFLISAVLALLAAFQYASGSSPASTSATGSTISSIKEADMPENEILLPDDISIREFFYNPAKNTICLMSQSENNYQLYLLGVDNVWSPSSLWKVSSKDDLIHFVYSNDGKLYACMRTTQNKHISQNLVHLKKDGTVSRIPLRALEKVPKVSGQTSNTITDFQFSGTVLAVTYQNSAVKFYNIEEGHALGAPSIRGQEQQNIFYKYHYLSCANTKTSSLLLKDYDIRTGEQNHTITLADDADSNNKKFFLDNYREKVWLLSGDGIFAVKYTDSHFQRVLSWEELSLPEIHSVREFLSTRDNVLYASYLDDETVTHLVRFDIPQTSFHGESNTKINLDFPSNI